MKILIPIIFVLIPFNGITQLLDDMKQSFESKPKVMLKLGTRNSFISNRFVKIRDVQIGFNYKNITKIGLGYNWLATDVFRPLVIEGQIVQENKGELKMRYLAPFVEYTFLKKEKYSCAIPVQLGFGKTLFEYRNGSNELKKTKPISIAFYEPAITFEYIVLKYIGIGGGIGFRLMFIGNKRLNDNFTAPFYLLRAKIFFGDVLKDIL